MSAITTASDRIRIPTAAAIQRRWPSRSSTVLEVQARRREGRPALAMPYLDARDVADRLDEVLGLDGWQDDYEQLADGTMLCRLRVKIGRTWIVRCGVGGRASSPMPATARKPRRVTPSSGRPSSSGSPATCTGCRSSGWAGMRLAGSSPKRRYCRPGRCRSRHERAGRIEPIVNWRAKSCSTP